MTVLALNIEVYTDWKVPLTPEIAVNDTYEIVKQLDILFGDSKVWYLPGNTQEESLTRIAFDQQGITQEAINYFKEDYTEEFPMVTAGVWDGNDSSEGCAILYQSYRINQLGQTKIELNISIKEKDFLLAKLVDFIKFLVVSHNSPSVMIENGQYSLKLNHVFPDRLSAGWMLYLPTEIDPALVPMVEESLSISDKEGQIGTLIVTTKEIFDIENKEHINKANDIEICLRDLQLLPLLSEI
ncbi:hypothetical protein [Xenorhabdus szentirmaii]|uniref:Immunity 52 family protein n=1 Tax=Xenorhabdus szentirmaii TaxID=290112 RepID=A0AAW3YQU8_9GAMM|nr:MULTISPECIES: hypothetical protein [unclassified Xenorhabdus]MBD2781620.1 immunity 52 family protein [Xenorhabdus sp. 38]MBD2799464.1 immunity 52 family protein [Xenorhabdus sp. M]